MRALCILGVLLVAALAAPPRALAHAQLVRSDPKDGAVVKSPPRALRLAFDDTIRASRASGRFATAERPCSGAPPRVVRKRELLIPLQANLPEGDYTILWRALTDDGHSIAGVVAFAVGAGRAPPRVALSAPSGQPPLQIVARWLFIIGILTASGAALFALALRGAAAPPPGLFVAAFLLVIAGGVVLQEQAWLATRFGRIVVGANIVAGVGAALAAAAGRHRLAAPAAWGAALLLLPAPSLAGHALDAGRPWFELPVDLLHVAASSLWLGGLLAWH